MLSNSPAGRGALGGAMRKEATFTAVFTLWYGTDPLLHEDSQQESGRFLPQSVSLFTPQHPSWNTEHSGLNLALIPLTRLFQSHRSLNQIPIARPFCGVFSLLKISIQFRLYFIANLVKGQSRVTKRHVEKDCAWVWDSPLTHLSAVYTPRSAPSASGETGAGKTARNHSHNPTISIRFCINDHFLNIFTIKYQVNTTYWSFVIHYGAPALTYLLHH